MDGLLRIGELSKRAGVSPELLRAWERRYGLLTPTRSAGGLRLYSSADVARVERMRRHLADGLAAAEAAALATQSDADPPPAVAPLTPVGARDELADALDSFDAPPPHAGGAPRGGRRRARLVRGAPRESRGRSPARRGDGGHAAGRGRPAVPARARRPLGTRRGFDRARALRVRRTARALAGPGSWLGPRHRTDGTAGLPAWRAARPRPDRVRTGAAGAGRAHGFARQRRAARDGGGGQR